jgi:hypothetical protein
MCFWWDAVAVVAATPIRLPSVLDDANATLPSQILNLATFLQEHCG